MKKLISFISCIGLVGWMLFPISTFANTSDTTSNEINLSITPDDILFNIENMKPGDWAPRSITVNNSGNQEFDYMMTVENQGEDKLFNELLLSIQDQKEQILYDGKLSDFESLNSRYLNAGDHEDLHITVTFPEHLGNEFQGASSSFSFIFYAEGATEQGEKEEDVTTISGVVDNGDSSGGQSLPNTATSIFTFLLLGLLVVVCGIGILAWQKYRSIPDK